MQKTMELILKFVTLDVRAQSDTPLTNLIKAIQDNFISVVTMFTKYIKDN